MSALTFDLKRHVEGAFRSVSVHGEILSARRVSSGHLYFTLSDSQAKLPVVVWRSALDRMRLDLRDGMKVVVDGDIQIYPPHGRYQLVARRVVDAGLGALLLQLEALKQRLAAEGLFDQERKRALPALPRRIGVVTAATGAAIRDILATIQARFPVEVVIFGCRVQGRGAAEAIAQGIAALDGWPGVELIICGRGGGSLEDLWAFNEETVVRAIAACETPIISAVGHEVDTPLSDLAADYRAPTPTAAAERAVPDGAAFSAHVVALKRRALLGVGRHLTHHQQRLEQHAKDLGDPARLIGESQQRLDGLRLALDAAATLTLSRRREHLRHTRLRLRSLHPAARLGAARDQLESLRRRLQRAANLSVTSARQRLLTQRRTLNVLSPTASLERGYAIVLDGSGQILRHSQQAAPGDRVEILLHRGALTATVDARRSRHPYEHPGPSPEPTEAS